MLQQQSKWRADWLDWHLIFPLFLYLDAQIVMLPFSFGRGCV